MATAPSASRDPVLEAHAFWYKFKTQIVALIFLVVLAIVAFGAYKLYSDRRDSAAAAALAAAKTPQDYEQVMARYPNAPAGASASLFLADAQRNQRKFTESNATLQAFIDKHPKHELVSTAALAVAANLEAMGKVDEALAQYQQVAKDYAQTFAAPLALISEVPILKAKNKTEEARVVYETIISQYGNSLWAMQAMQELRSMKPAAGASLVPGTGSNRPLMPMGAPPTLRAPLAVPQAPALSPSQPKPAPSAAKP
jgi:predicted negative regulator of RcsB-dependent stress response